MPHRPSKNIFVTCLVCILLMSTSLSGCGLLGLIQKSTAPVSQVPEPVVVTPKPIVIERPSAKEIRFAQTALSSLGYKLGAIDGMWGPRSARAMQKFEADNGLASVNGRLSDLNLNQLKKFSDVIQNPIKDVASAKKVHNISSKIDGDVPLASAPQLVFVDRAYSLLSKPNPFSEPLTIIRANTGIYIIDVQDGWYEVETGNQQRGFIKDQ